MRPQLLLTSTLVALLGCPVWAGDLVIRPDQHYLLLATERTSTMQKELDLALQHGFRVLRGAPARSEQVAFFLERTGRSTEPGYYVLLATSRVGTMQREMNELAGRGYRLHPDTVMWVDCEIVLLMERTASEDGRYRYELLSTERTSTLQREVDDSRMRGFEIADMIFTKENFVVMEKVD